MTPIQEPPSDQPETGVPAVDVHAAELDSLRKALADEKELNQSLSADFENFKRRSRQESESRAAAQKESFIHELLPALDNLERALASGADAASPRLHQGVEMTLRQLRQLLQQHGIEPDESVGQPFDARCHEAISQGHDPSHPDHAILEVFQRGYRRGETIFRAAKVVVNDLTHPKHARHVR